MSATKPEAKPTAKRTDKQNASKTTTKRRNTPIFHPSREISETTLITLQKPPQPLSHTHTHTHTHARTPRWLPAAYKQKRGVLP